MGKKPAVKELIRSIEEVYYDGHDRLWAKYQDSVDLLDEDDSTIILHSVIEHHEELRRSRYGGDISRSVLHDMIVSLLDHGADISRRINEEFPLRLTKDPKIIQLLLGRGADPNALNPRGYTPLMNVHEAESVKLLLDAGANPNAINENGYTALKAHCGFGSGEALGMLLEAGADPDQRDADGRTLLMSTYLRHETLKVLLEAGADPNARDNKGMTPLMFVGELEFANSLREHGADFKARDDEGRTVLMHALGISYQEAKTIASLIKFGAPLNEVDMNGNCALRFEPNGESENRSYAYGESDAKFVNLLLKEGALPDLPNKKGETPLMYWAGNEGNKESRKVVDLLIRNGADTNKVDDKGLDALMYAAKNNNQRCIKLLLQKKADPLKRSTNGWSCVEWSIPKGKPPTHEMIDALLGGGANVNGSHKSPKSTPNLLGKFLLAEDFTYCVALLKRGAVINRSTLSTMGLVPEDFSGKKRSSGNEFGANNSATKLLSFSRLNPALFQQSIDREDVEVWNALKNLGKQKSGMRSNLKNPLHRLEPGYWPPCLPERTRIEVKEIIGREMEPQLRFTEDEIENYLDEGVADSSLVSNFCRYRSISAGNKSEEERLKIIEQKAGRNNYLLFKDILRVSDQALIHLWNDVVSTNSNLFRVGSPSGFGYRSISSPECKFVLARCGIAVLPGLLNLVSGKTNVLLRVLLPVADTKLAPLMANGLLGSPVSPIARKWFVRHPEAAVHGLIPFAVGPASGERDNCEAALRYLASRGYASNINEVSATYGKDVRKSVQEILSVDVCSDYLRKSLPELQSGWFGDEIRRPVVLQTGKPLPDRNLPALFGMMSVSTYDDVYPAIHEIKPLLEPTALAEFAWSAFIRWESMPGSTSASGAEKKTKKEAVWAFHSLAYLGNDQTVKLLIPLIKTWPREGRMSKAVVGLDILANIGTDFAIRSINSILLKTRYKPLLERATVILETIADIRSLTRVQLEDRMVPGLGLDDAGGMTLDFGTRAFFVQIDEKLKSLLVDSSGKTIKALPRAAKGDDKQKVKEATARWKEFKADLKTEASTQLFRLERAMIEERRWTGSDFRSLLAGHPLLRHVVSSLVWADYEGKKPQNTFRADKDGTFLTSRDELFELDDTATIGIPHPLAIKSLLKGWGECLAQHRVRQAFPQIGRQYFVPKDDSDGNLFGVQGGKAPTKVFRGMKAKGWMPEIGDGGSIWGFHKQFSGGKVSLEFDGIVTMHDYNMDDEEKTISVDFPMKLTPVEYSELVRELKELLH